MNDTILSINDLTKHYGSIRAVDHFSIEIKKGTVYGILGPNGSGKTTILGSILGVTVPTSGSFMWFGREPSNEDRKRIGSILEVPVFYPYMTAYRNLRLIAYMKRISYEDIDRVLDMVGLTERRNSLYKTYSLGMKQRLAIAAALLGRPEVLILDEPTNGLDPLGIAEIRRIILDVAAEGTTILLASHILDEVQKICSHVAVIEKGKKLFSGEVAEILNDLHWIEISAENKALLGLALKECPLVLSYSEEGGKFLVKLHDGVKTDTVNSFFYEKGIVLTHLASRKKSLENYFIDLMKKQ